MVRLDPNDPNIVVGIPDEPVVTAEVSKEGKKVSRECIVMVDDETLDLRTARSLPISYG